MRITARAALAAGLALPFALAPLAAEEPGRLLGVGLASYYAASFAGMRTASGEPYRPEGLTGAHRTAPLGSRVLVTNLGNGRAVTVLINDRGPHVSGRVIDLSWAAAREIGLDRSGTARVRLERVD